MPDEFIFINSLMLHQKILIRSYRRTRVFHPVALSSSRFTLTQPERHMQPFNLDTFTHRLLGETLFYDEEFGALGTLSLVDGETLQERYLAHYVPEDGNFLVEEATDWEDYEPTEEDDVGRVINRLREHGVSRLPVVNENGYLTGIVTTYDVDTFSADLTDPDAAYDSGTDDFAFA